MTPQELLKKAAKAIEVNGFTKGTYRDSSGCLCMYGAINLIANNDPIRCCVPNENWEAQQDAIRLLRDTLELTTEDNSVVNFNDAEKTTQKDVIAMLLKAAGE